jgi:hypothetical protein
MAASAVCSRSSMVRAIVQPREQRGAEENARQVKRIGDAGRAAASSCETPPGQMQHLDDPL